MGINEDTLLQIAIIVTVNIKLRKELPIVVLFPLCDGTSFKKRKTSIFNLVYVHVYPMYESVDINADAHKGQQRALHPLQPGLQVVVNSPEWMLGTELESPARTVNAVNYCGSSSTLNKTSFKFIRHSRFKVLKVLGQQGHGKCSTFVGE